MKLFKPEMFDENKDPYYFDFSDARTNDLADFCNQILTDYVKTLPEVRGISVDDVWYPKVKIIDLRNIETEKE